MWKNFQSDGFESTYHVGTQIDAQNGDGTQRQGNIGDDEEQEGRDFGDVGRQSVGDGFLQVVEDETTLLHTGHDRSKVVVQEDHVGRLFGHVRSGDTHGDTCSHKLIEIRSFGRLKVIWRRKMNLILKKEKLVSDKLSLQK